MSNEMTIRNGLYSLTATSRDSVDGEVGGVLILRNGNVHGGDAYVYYTGSYESSAGTWQGKLSSQEHTPTTRLIAARVQHIMALVGEQGIRYHATLRLLVEI